MSKILAMSSTLLWRIHSSEGLQLLICFKSLESKAETFMCVSHSNWCLEFIIIRYSYCIPTQRLFYCMSL